MLLTASGLERAAVCPPSCALPAVRGETSEAAERGTALHQFLANVGAMGRDEALRQVPDEWRESAAVIPVDALPLGQGLAEVPFAFDTLTKEARLLKATGRDYRDLGPFEIAGTADWVGLTPDRVVVLDYKSGRNVTPARINPQLRFYALCAARVYNRDAATVGAVYLREGDPPWFDLAELDAFDLDAVAAEVADIHGRVVHAQELLNQGITPDVTVSEHCRYCNAYNSCPAKTGLIRYAATPQLAEQRIQSFMPDRVDEAYALYKGLAEVVKRAGAQFFMYAREVGPIRTGNGKLLGPVTTTRETVTDARKARDLMRDGFGQELADIAVEPETSKTAIEGALKAHGVPPAGRRAFLDLLRAEGAITSKTTETVKEYEPKEPASGVG